MSIDIFTEAAPRDPHQVRGIPLGRPQAGGWHLTVPDDLSAMAVRVPLQNSPQGGELRFGLMDWLRQDRGLCPFACST